MYICTGFKEILDVGGNRINKAHRFSCEQFLVQESEKLYLEQGWGYPIIQLSLCASLNRLGHWYLSISMVLSQGSVFAMFSIFLSWWMADAAKGMTFLPSLLLSVRND